MILGLENWIFYTGLGLILFIIGFFIEPVRDFYTMIWEYLADAFNDVFSDFGSGLMYLITFEWVRDIPGFFSNMFEDMSEFSIFGLVFGIASVVLIYYVRSYTIAPFVQYYSPPMALFWTIATYIAVFIGGYLVGRGMDRLG